MGVNKGQGRKGSSHLGVNKVGKIAGRRNMNQMMTWKKISQGNRETHLDQKINISLPRM